MAGTILILVAIGLGLGILIYVVNIVIPQKVKGLERTEEIAEILPGANCGACGNPSCFAYAKALSDDSSYLTKNPCGQVVQDEEALKRLEEMLGITIDAAEMSKEAFVHCNGNSEVVYDYSGVQSCKGAAQLLKGYKKCPYACLGLGDCVAVCPEGAISIDPAKKVAIVDPDKCVGCGLCKTECPQNVIELVPGRTKVTLLCNYQTLRDTPGREKCDAGCIHCRKCLKACEFEAITFDTQRGIPIFDSEKCTRCGKCIEVCPQGCLAEFAGYGSIATPV
ncbi:MAG: 4Fe-4S binding protein [Dehalococcoidales bacterium]|nr:4Fe-4S binding protein [Dehalococcoidales bacterium]